MQIQFLTVHYCSKRERN